jgi:hypothetical protein
MPQQGERLMEQAEETKVMEERSLVLKNDIKFFLTGEI